MKVIRMTKSLNFDAIVANTFKDNHKQPMSHLVANRVMTFWLIFTSDVKKLGNNKVWKKKPLPHTLSQNVCSIQVV
jgi:hypothetical protein